MSTTRWVSFISGTLLTVIGIFLLSRLIVVERPPDNNVVGLFIIILLGISFLLIGISSLLRALKSLTASAIDTPSSTPETQNEGGFLLQLGQFFTWLGHSVVLLSIAGTVWLVLFAKTGGVSGVPIGIGIIVSIWQT